MSDTGQALLINAIVLIAVLEADVGRHRKIGWLRILRPVLLAGAIVPLFIVSPTTHGSGLALELSGAAVGLVLGLVATALFTVYLSPESNRPVSRAGVGYVLLWVLIIGARSAFSYGSHHWFASQLGSWMDHHAVSVAAITDTLILMAVAMLATRTIGLLARAHLVYSGADLRSRPNASV